MPSIDVRAVDIQQLAADVIKFIKHQRADYRKQYLDKLDAMCKAKDSWFTRLCWRLARFNLSLHTDCELTYNTYLEELVDDEYLAPGWKELQTLSRVSKNFQEELLVIAYDLQDSLCYSKATVVRIQTDTFAELHRLRLMGKVLYERSASSEGEVEG